MFHEVPAVLRKRAKAAAAERGAKGGDRAEVWVAFAMLYIVNWGGVEGFELPMLWFSVFFYLEFLRSAPKVPDAATAGGSSSRLCVDKICPDMMVSLLVAIVLKYTFRVWSVFLQVT